MSPTTYDPRAAGRARHHVDAKPEAGARGAIGAPVVVVLLFLVMVIVDQMRGGSGATATHVRVPDSVVGTWIAEDPRYAGRSIQVDPALVVIRRGDRGAASVGTVKDVRSWREGGQDVVRLDYHTEEGDFSIELMPQDRGGMRLRNPNDVLWVRR